MNFTKITEEDLLNKGVFGLPDTPGLTTQQMQEKFDELSKDVIIPKFNALIEELKPIKSIERVSNTVEESDNSIPTGNAVKKLVNNKANELAKKPVYKSAGGFPEVGDAFTVYIDDTVSPRLLYTWDEEKGYILTGGSGGGENPGASIVLMEITSEVYEALPDNEKMRDDVQYFISDKGIIKYKDKSYGGNGGGGLTIIQKTYAEYQALPESEKMREDVIYEITDREGGVKFGSGDISEIGDGTVTGAMIELDSRGKTERSSNTVPSVYGSEFTVTSLPLKADHTYLVTAGLAVSVANPSQHIAAILDFTSGNGTLMGYNNAKGFAAGGGGLSLTTVVSCETDATLSLRSYGYENVSHNVTGTLVAVKLT